MHKQGQKQEIYTIGHSNHTASYLVQLLKKYKIEIIVDVRSVPYSKYSAQFNRENIELTLVASGIMYLFKGDIIGGRPENPEYYKNRKIPKGKISYLELIDYHKLADDYRYQASINDLIKKSVERRMAVMCSEEDPILCHRHHLIAKTLLKKGITVWHIRGQGFIEEAVFENKQQRALSDYM